jgi:hypothetical protein
LVPSENTTMLIRAGMLDHGLEIVACALKLRQARLLLTGVPPKNRRRGPTAAAAYAALLHDAVAPRKFMRHESAGNPSGRFHYKMRSFLSAEAPPCPKPSRNQKPYRRRRCPSPSPFPA